MPEVSVENSATMIHCAGVQASAMQRAASGATSLGKAATHAAAEVLQQDEHSTEWRTQRKHFFVLTNAGVTLNARSPARPCQAPMHHHDNGTEVTHLQNDSYGASVWM